MKRKGILLAVMIATMIGLSFSGMALEGLWDSMTIEDNEVICGEWDNIKGGAIGNQTIDKNSEINETCDNVNNSVDNNSIAGQINQTEMNETISKENINNETHNIIDNQTISNATVDSIEDEIEKIDNETSEVLINKIGGERNDSNQKPENCD